MRDTNWLPELAENGPRYRALADAIAEAVTAGRLKHGEKLPPVRDLAWRLQVTPGTVARAYQLGESRGLLEGHVGRGTFVCAKETPHASWSPIAREPPTAGVVDLRLNRAPDIGQDATITAALTRLIARYGALPLTDYHRYGDDQSERAAGAEWLRSGEVPAEIDDLIICSGAQHGMLTALSAAVGGGDAIALTEPLIHPGLKDCARAIGLRLEPVASDEDGLEPEALDAACDRWRPGAIILTANNQNPLMTTMPLARREAIAEIARRRNVAIIEDDVYGWLNTRRAPSFPSVAPERTWYVTSLSKCVAAGLRVGYLLTPPGEGPRAARILQGHTYHVSWLLSGLAAELIRSGDAAAIVAKVREETAAREQLVAQAFAESVKSAGREPSNVLQIVKTTPTSTMAWLSLPEPWRASDFCAVLESERILVSPAEIFTVGRSPAPHAVRIGFGNVKARRDVGAAIPRIVEMLRAGPSPADSPV